MLIITHYFNEDWLEWIKRMGQIVIPSNFIQLGNLVRQYGFA